MTRSPERKLSDYRFAYGKRRDGLGWDILVIDGEHVECVGPYKLQREAREAIASGAAVERAQSSQHSAAERAPVASRTHRTGGPQNV